MCMFKAQDPTHLLSGYILCMNCSCSTLQRLKITTAEVESFGLDINQIIKLQPQISALQSSAQRITSIAEAMRCAGFLESDVNDVNLVSLLTQWICNPLRVARSSKDRQKRAEEMATRSSKDRQKRAEEMATCGFASGRWTSEEHERFVSAYQMYGNDWKKVASVVKTRSKNQTRTHAQKYFQKLQKAASSSDSNQEDDFVDTSTSDHRPEKPKKEKKKKKRKSSEISPSLFDIALVRGTKSFELVDKSKIGIGLYKTQNGFVYFGDITPDSQADQAGIISGDVPLENGIPIEYDTFLAMAAKRPLVFDVKRYAYQQFYTKSSKAYIHREDLRLFNVGALKEMLKIKAGIDDNAVKKMNRSELIYGLGTRIEDSSDTVG